jgi:hypothetical protein
VRRVRLVGAALSILGSCGCKVHQPSAAGPAQSRDNEVFLTGAPLRVSPGVNPDVWGGELKLTEFQRDQAVRAREESNRLYAERMDALKAGKTPEDVKPLLDKQIAAFERGLDCLSVAQQARLFQLQLQRHMLHAAARHRDFVNELGLTESQLKAIAVIRTQHGHVQEGERKSRAYQVADIQDRKIEEQEEESDLTPAQLAKWKAMLGPIFVEKPFEFPKQIPRRKQMSPPRRGGLTPSRSQ